MKILIFIALLCFTSRLYANQITFLKQLDDTISIGNINNPNKESIDKLPEFPNGKRAMKEFINENLIYPSIAKEFEISGVVTIQFLVDKNGKIKNAEVLQGIEDGCDEEALRLINLMPDWNPGSKNKVNVNTLVKIDIEFTWTKDEAEKHHSSKRLKTAIGDTIKPIIERPVFSGGKDSLYKFFARNFKYPKDATKKEIEGVVTVDILLSKDGKIKRTKVIQKIEPSMDNEALRLINLLPEWKPALKNGKPSEFKCSLDFNFMRSDGWFVKNEGFVRPLSDTLNVFLNDTIIIRKKGLEDTITYVEQMPEYPGGFNALMKFLGSNVKYPVIAAEKGITGRVVVQFVIDKNGHTRNVRIKRGVGGGCSEEAIRVIKLMPPWKPGIQNGKVVPVYFTLPVVFQLKE